MAQVDVGIAYLEMLDTGDRHEDRVAEMRVVPACSAITFKRRWPPSTIRSSRMSPPTSVMTELSYVLAIMDTFPAWNSWHVKQPVSHQSPPSP
jgi:hypothetical protein